MINRIVGVVALVWGTVYAAELVARFGYKIPQPDLAGDFAIGILWASLIGMIILMVPTSYKQRMALFVLWVAKCAITLGLMLLYEYKYSLDAFGYFADSLSAYVAFPSVHLGVGTPLMVWLVWAHSQFLPASYHALKVTCSLIGLLAVFLSYRAWTKAFGREDLRVLLFIGLFPSVLFWSSILGKDPLVLFGIALYMYGGAGWLREHRLRYLPCIVLGVLIASAFRVWLAPILAGPFVVAAILSMRSHTARLAVAGVLGFSFLLLLGAAAARFGITGPSQVLRVVAAIGAEGRGWAVGGSANVISQDLSTVTGLISFLPRGIFAALYRPLPGDVMNAFGLIAGFEGVALLFLSIRAVRRSRLRDLFPPPMLWLTLLVLAWSLLYSVISYQNFGTGVRYRLQILPAFLLVLLTLSKTFSASPPDEPQAQPTPEPEPAPSPAPT